MSYGYTVVSVEISKITLNVVKNKKTINLTLHFQSFLFHILIQMFFAF